MKSNSNHQREKKAIGNCQLAHGKLQAALRSLRHLVQSPRTWTCVSQSLVGAFFLAAAYLKASEGFFGPARVPLSFIFHHWINNRLPLEIYRDFMLTIMPFADHIAIGVIVVQAIVGILLITHRQPRLAGLLILIVQGNIYMATYHHAELRVLGSQAMWFGIFFLARPYMHGRLWNAMTIVLCCIGLMHLYARYQFGDPWFASYAWQRQHYIEHVMGSSVAIKQLFLTMTEGAVGRFLWAAGWWFKLVLALGLLTRHRLLAGSLWLVYFMWISVVWLNAWNCEGVFWVLILFVWVTWEYRLRSHRTGAQER